jgi:hypothetical protein
VSGSTELVGAVLSAACVACGQPVVVHAPPTALFAVDFSREAGLCAAAGEADDACAERRD